MYDPHHQILLLELLKNFHLCVSLLSLSEQQLVDCSHVDDNCKSGLVDHAFAYAMKFPARTESSYAYEHKFGTCRKSCGVGVPKGSVHDSEHSLMDALVQQPVSVAVEGDKRDFQVCKLFCRLQRVGTFIRIDFLC